MTEEVKPGMTDVYGFAVNIAKARVFNQEGLMFTMGSRCLTLTLEEFKALSKFESKLPGSRP